MKKLMVIVFLPIFIFAIFFNFCYASPYLAETKHHTPPHKQEKCPVMGYPISKEVYIDYKGKRIYFCCSACKKEFLKDPDNYMERLEKKGVILEKPPKAE